MDPKVVAFELQDDKTVKRKAVSLTFPRQNDGRLYVITNRKSRCHFCQAPDEEQSFKKAPRSGEDWEEKMIFQYGVSAKVFSVTDSTGSKWEVRLLLSPSEISRLSSSFNLIGCFYVYLVSEEFRHTFKELLHEQKKSEPAAEKICKAIAPFLCLPNDELVNDFHTQLSRIVKEIIIESVHLSEEEAIMLAGGLTVLQAAELAAELGSSNVFDYRGEKKEGQETQDDQIPQMVKAFNIQTELLAVSHQEKKVHVIFRNPCTDNWASGGRKCVAGGETFEFGLCHKVFSISEPQSEIQFLQSLQESYDMVAVFHIATFTKHLLMTKKWRKALDVLLKEGHKQETIDELSQLALQFVCSVECNLKVFLKVFRKQLTETLSKVQTLPVGGEAVCVFGLLVATMAALKAKAVVDKQIDDSDGDTEQPVPPKDEPSEGAPDCNKIGLPKTQEVDYPVPESIGPNVEKNGTDNEAADDNIGGTSRGLADGLEDNSFDLFEKANEENNKGGSSSTHGVEAPDIGTSSPYPDDASHLSPLEEPIIQKLQSNTDCQLSRSHFKTFGLLESSVDPLPAEEPQGLLESSSKNTTLGTYNDGEQNPNEGNAFYPGSSVDRVISEASVGQVHDPHGGQRTECTMDTNKPISMPPKLESTTKDTQKTSNQDRQTIDHSGDESSTFNPQNEPSPQKSPERTESDIDKPVHPSAKVHGGEDTSHRLVEPSSLSVPLIVLIVAMIIASLMLPSQVRSMFFTGVVLLLVVHLFISRRP